MDRDTILAEIRRAASDNGGVAVGRDRFEKMTGITAGVWLGRYWARWSDAVAEAGFTPRTMQEGYDEEHLLECLAHLALHNGRLPTFAEIKLRRRTDKGFPGHGAFSTLGGLEVRISKLRSFAERHAQFERILGMLPEADQRAQLASAEPVEVDDSGDGHVYMLKLGKHYKFGRTYAVPRRHREIALELPEKPSLVHAIRTDDPEGIELYWHRRFSQKQTNGEWFALNAEEVRAFKRRKFM